MTKQNYSVVLNVSHVQLSLLSFYRLGRVVQCLLCGNNSFVESYRNGMNVWLKPQRNTYCTFNVHTTLIARRCILKVILVVNSMTSSIRFEVIIIL